MASFDVHRIKGILLDLDDTLYDAVQCYDRGKVAACSYLAEKTHHPLTRVFEAFERGRVETKRQFTSLSRELAASHSRLLYLQKAIEELTGKTNSTLTLEAEQVYWDASFEIMQPYPNVREFLQQSRQRKKTILIVTDLTAQIQFKKLIKLGIHTLIDFVVTSEEAGREKPDQEPLRLALRKATLTSEDVVMVGNDERDVKAAQALGIPCIVVWTAPTQHGGLFAKDFQELSNILLP